MGLLSKLLGGGFDRLVEKASQLEKRGDLGDALIEYERALAGDRESVDAGRIQEVESRAMNLRDRIADEHIEAGDHYLEDGNLEQAVEEYQTALQAAGTEGKEDEVQGRLDGLEADLARELAADAREPTEEETFQALSGSWDEDQWDEYEEYGDGFRAAYLSYHAGRIQEAVDGYSAMLEEAGEDAVFLLFELGRARAAMAARIRESFETPHGQAPDDGEDEAAEEQDREAMDCFQRFLDRLPRGSAPAVRAAAWNELAQIHLEHGEPDDAEDALMNAQEAVPDEPLAYLNLGRFLLRQDRPAEAVEALEAGAEVMDKLRPDFRILSELGLAHRAAGDEDSALEALQVAVDGMVQFQQGFHDPYVAIPLAEILENKGRPREASDLYRHLAQGPDVARHALYNYHSARLLAEIGETELSRSHLARARELVGDDEDLEDRIARMEAEQ